MAETLGAVFAIDITDLKKGLAQANRLIRESETEFKSAAAGMDDWTKSADGLNARLTHLRKVVEIQTAKVAALEEEKQNIIDTMTAEGKSNEEIARAVDEVNKKILREQTVLIKARQEIGKQEKALNTMTAETDDAADAAGDLADATKEAGDAAGKSAKETKKAGDAAKDAADGFTVAKGAVAGFIANGLSALAGAAKDAISSIANLAESTREYRTIMASLETSSARAGYTAEQTAETYGVLNGVLGDTQAAATTTANLQALGFEQDKLMQITNGVIGAWSRYGDSIPIDGLAESVNETIKAGKVTGTFADVLNWAGESEDNFNTQLENCATETQRANLVMKLFADQGLMEAGEAWQTNNKSITDANAAQDRFEKTTAKLGQKVEPITTRVRNGFTNILETVVKLADGANMTKIERSIDKTFSTFTNKILPKVVSGVQWLIKNGDVLLDTIKAIGIGFAAFKAVNIIKNTVSAITGMIAALKAAKTAQDTLNVAMSANVIGAVVTGIIMLVDACKRWVKAGNDVAHGWDEMTEAADRNAAANAEWRDTMDEARATLGDFSGMTTAAGESAEDLENKMRTAQSNITQVYATAFNENRGLRDDEIAQIHQFTSDYNNALLELEALNRARLEAQVEGLKYQLENLDLSEEETQGVLNTLKDLNADYVASLNQSVYDQIAILDMRAQKEGGYTDEMIAEKDRLLAKLKTNRTETDSIMQGAEQAALDHLQSMANINMEDYNNRTHHFGSMEEIQSYYNQKIDELAANEELNGWQRFWARQSLYADMSNAMNDFSMGMDASWTNYNFLTDQKIQENERAYFNWLGQTIATGGELTEENKQNAADILAAYSDLPEELQDSGLNALKGLAEGVLDDATYNSLISNTETDAQDLINAINEALGNHSPSWKTKQSGKNVMLGLQQGMKGQQSATNSVAARIAGGIISTFKRIFQEHSPSKVTVGIGENLGIGLANGLDNSTKDVIGAAKRQVRAVNSVYGVLGTAGSGSTGAAQNRNAGNGTGAAAGNTRNVTVYQTNNYSQAHSRFEIYKSKQQTAAAVRLALEGGV